MKILVNVSVPAVGESYDILIPGHLKIGAAIALIAEAAEGLSGQRYTASGEERLCSADKNTLLRPDLTVMGYGIRNGERLILM